MIELTHGNLLEDQVDALVNTVNTAGVMGKGVALQFKQAFPENFKAYKRACDRKEVTLGRMFVFHNSTFGKPDIIINFPTKGHWKARSRLSDVESGLRDLARVITEYSITSIAVPPLGCGNGGLDWQDVRPLIEKEIGGLPGVAVHLYPPEGAPAAATMPIGTERPRLTRGRAAVIAALARYIPPGLAGGVTRLEIQKLMYLVQSAGEPLKLNYTKQKYGPYSETLQHVLQNMEGHYLRGYGDRTAPNPITVNDEWIDESTHLLEQRWPETLSRLDAVGDLIDGFESPYGLELLATVHWVVTAEGSDRRSEDDVVAAVQAWSKRKKRLFTDRHIRVAMARLDEQGWFDDDFPDIVAKGQPTLI